MKLLLLALLFFCECAAASCGFRAYKGGMDQASLAAYNYTPLSWPVAAGWSTGFDTKAGTWTPPAGLVLLTASVWVYYGATDMYGGTPNYVIKVIKSSSRTYEDTMAGICTPGTWPNSMVCQLSAVDQASGTDSYQLNLYATSASAVVNGNSAHTYWSGACLP